MDNRDSRLDGLTAWPVRARRQETGAWPDTIPQEEAMNKRMQSFPSSMAKMLES